MKEHTASNGVVRKTLGAREKFLLTQMIIGEYKKSALPDEDFAPVVQERLGFSPTAIHIANIRREFEIPANVSRSPRNTGASNVFRAEVMRRLDQLEAQIETLLRERAERAHRGVNHG